MPNYTTGKSKARRSQVHIALSSMFFPSNTFGNSVYDKALGTAILISPSDNVGEKLLTRKKTPNSNNKKSLMNMPRD